MSLKISWQNWFMAINNSHLSPNDKKFLRGVIGGYINREDGRYPEISEEEFRQLCQEVGSINLGTFNMRLALEKGRLVLQKVN
ncbi:MAG: hypothetical protein U5L76_00310 [Patescibacteria group bacterium]|nr:hypothetical protein [Patescibacteria group bacterium]